MVHESKQFDTKTFYITGATSIFASKADQRFSYCMYVPTRKETDPQKFPLVVIQHGTGRNAGQYRDAMQDFCEENRAVVLAPLFPAGIDIPGDLHNFKFLDFNGIRFDLLLLDIIDEIAELVPVETSKFYLHGFSGGGQFTHRFMYLHPERLIAASVGAPGRLTFLDDSKDWWLGTANIEEHFNQKIDIDAIKKLKIQLVVGSNDTDTWEINNPGDSNWIDGLEEQGNTRVERLQNYQKNLASHGIESRLDIVEGIAHDGMGALPTVQKFFAEVLASQK